MLTKINPDPDTITRDVLIETRFHKALVLFAIPAAWPAWKVGLVLVAQAIVVAGIWWLVVGQLNIALITGLIMAIFFTFDSLLFRFLPDWGISYGSWQSQTFVISLPRSVAAVVISSLVVLVGMEWALGVLLLVELSGSLIVVYSTLVEPFRLQLTYLEVKTDRLSSQTKPIRILHISDLHIERLTRRESQLMVMVDQSNPDLILITGDYLNLSYVRDSQAQSDIKALLNQLSAPHGVFAILGSPTVDDRTIAPSFFNDSSVRLLRDEWQLIELDDERRIVLLGMECSHHMATDRAQLNHLLETAPNTLPRVLLYHAPDLMPEATQQEIDLYLCGHTHGGQVRLPGYGAILTSSFWGKRFEMGHYHEGRTHMYVSRGVGLEGLSAPRIRFLAPPEITLVTIEGANT